MSFINDTKTKDVINSVLKQIGSKLLKGEIKDIMGISKPVALTKDVSYIEIVSK